MKYCLTIVPCAEETRLETILKTRKHSAVAATTSSSSDTKKTRHKVSMKGAVITDEEYSKQIFEKEMEDKLKEQKKEERKKKKALKAKMMEEAPNKDKKRKKTKKRVNPIDSDSDSQSESIDLQVKRKKPGEIFRRNLSKIKISDDEEENVGVVVLNSDDDVRENGATQEQSGEKTEKINQKDETHKDKSLLNSTETSIISKLDDCNIGDYFAVRWPNPCTYYWGKLLKVFAEDPEADADKVEMKFLHRKQACVDPTKFLWDWPSTDDVDIVDATWCFAGPVKPTLTNAVRGKAYMQFDCEKEVMELFNKINKSKK